MTDSNSSIFFYLDFAFLSQQQHFGVYSKAHILGFEYFLDSVH